MYVDVNRNQKSLCQLSGTDRIVGIKVVAGWFIQEQIGGLIPEVGREADRVRNHGGDRSVGEPKDSQLFERLQRRVSR
jgi:hypothetical protein